jgi:hypothetical protein
MDASFGPRVSTGIALVGTGIIAFTTIAPAPSEARIAPITIASPAVRLTAAPNPFEYTSHRKAVTRHSDSGRADPGRST